MFEFTIHHLRFSVEATTPILLDEYKGSALRGAWHSYMQRAYCGAPPGARDDPLHQAMCPVCYLTGRETGPESRRPYALQPPLSRQTHYDLGEHFQFGFTLFGNAAALFPYVLLAVRELGETYGIGGWLGERRQRGRFRLYAVEACDPHRGLAQTLLAPGENLVMQPTLAVTADSIAHHTHRLLSAIENAHGQLRLECLTPLRLIDQSRLMHQFNFGAFFQRLLERLYALAQHFSPAPERYTTAGLRAAVNELAPLAARVEVMEDHTTWWDVKGYSSRKGGTTYLGGLVGGITLFAEDWAPLLPYLLWGQSVQLGKNVVKGGGWFEIDALHTEEIDHGHH